MFKKEIIVRYKAIALLSFWFWFS